MQYAFLLWIVSDLSYCFNEFNRSINNLNHYINYSNQYINEMNHCIKEVIFFALRKYFSFLHRIRLMAVFQLLLFTYIVVSFVLINIAILISKFTTHLVLGCSPADFPAIKYLFEQVLHDWHVLIFCVQGL